MNYLIRGTEQWDEEHRQLLARKIAEKLNAVYYRLDCRGDWNTVAIYNYHADEDTHVYANCLNTLLCREIFLEDLETQ